MSHFRYFCETLLDFQDPCPVKEQLRNKVVSRLVKEGSTADEPANIALSDYSSLSSGGDQSSSSSSDEENDESSAAMGSGENPKLDKSAADIMRQKEQRRAMKVKINSEVLKRSSDPLKK